MAQPFYDYTEEMTTIELGVHLLGMSTIPVTANLTVTQRSLQGDSTSLDHSSGFEYWLDDSQLSWGAGGTGKRVALLHVGGNVQPLASGGLLVAIDTAENADINTQNSTSLVSALDQHQLIVGFALQDNQVSALACQDMRRHMPLQRSYSIVTMMNFACCLLSLPSNFAFEDLIIAPLCL